MNIGTLLPRHPRYRADHLALAVGARRLCYWELNACVNRLAHALLGAGLEKGDKFATVLPNSLALMAAYWAAAKTGTVIVPLSPLLNAPGLASLLRDSDAALVIGDAAFLPTSSTVSAGNSPASPPTVTCCGAPTTAVQDFGPTTTSSPASPRRIPPMRA